METNKNTKKLIIGQFDPTSSCGNCCNHCGDSSLPRGVNLPLENIAELLSSGFFRLSGTKTSEYEEGDFLARYPKYHPGSLKKLVLAGGGDPTYYRDGAAGFVELLELLSGFAREILVHTGGLNPKIGVTELSNAVEKMGGRRTSTINVCVTHHPFGSSGHEERIKRTLTVLAEAPISEFALKVICFSENALRGMSEEVRKRFPYLTQYEFCKTDLYRWISEKFKGMSDLVMLLDPYLGPEIIARIRDDHRPLISLLFEERTLRRCGRACSLPLELSSALIYYQNVDAMAYTLKKDGAPYPLRVTAEGYITGCGSSKFPRPEMYEGDLYGHSYDEIAHNRLLFLGHFLSELEELRSRAMAAEQFTPESGHICDNVCARAREAFVRNPARIRSHRGSADTVLKLKHQKRCLAVA